MNKRPYENGGGELVKRQKAEGSVVQVQQRPEAPDVSLVLLRLAHACTGVCGHKVWSVGWTTNQPG